MSLSIAFIHEVYPFGGAENITSILSDYLLSKGNRISVFACQFISERVNSSVSCNLLPQLQNIYSKVNADYIISTINANQIDILVVPNLHIKLQV